MPSTAWGQPASALFLEALREGDYSFLSPKPSCRKVLPGVHPAPPLSDCGELRERDLCAGSWARSRAGEDDGGQSLAWRCSESGGDPHGKTQSPGTAKVRWGRAGYWGQVQLDCGGGPVLPRPPSCLSGPR